MKNIAWLIENGLNNENASSAKREMYGHIQTLASGLVNFNLQKTPIAVVASSNFKTLELMFAVVLSGNFYVPIDLECPIARLETMLEGINFILCQEGEVNDECLAMAEKTGKVVTYYEDLISSVTKKHLLDVIKQNLLPSDPLYMVFTSGSTGKSKGVVKSHGAMLSFLEAFLQEYPINAEDVIGNQTPLYFDASAKDIYLYLASGAELKFIPKRLFSFPTQLIQHLNQEKITTILWVPSALTIVAKLNAFKYILPTSLKRVFFVGEVFRPKFLNYWTSFLPQVEFVNVYGSSETAGVVCHYKVKRQLEFDESLPIGKPFSNTRIYLVDDEGKESKQGEIVVESEAVAIGYFNDEVKTREKFFVKGGKKYYKTGDLAKFDNEGNLVFTSRSDYQIKHMGHRIELGDIESAVYALPEITDACVLYNSEKEKIKLFYSTADGKALDEVNLRAQLKKLLPDYMIPSQYMFLKNLPKNHNGKIDKQALKNCL